MWQLFKQFVGNLQSYPYLSPDLTVRRQVEQQLRSRPCLDLSAWRSQYWQRPILPAAPPPSPALIEFVYRQLATYSGLPMGRVRPSDRLQEDLCFAQVCWFDWGLTLCDEFEQSFGIDITDSFDETQLSTLADLVSYLQQAAEAPPASA